MKPATCQRMTSFLNNGQEELGLDSRLSASKVMHCNKCVFVSADSVAFRKHMLEHMASRYYCFYCNHVAYSETELHAHLKQHTTTYTHKCQYCGQGYMRRDYLENHIKRLHGKSVDQGLCKPAMTKIPHSPVSSVLPRAPRGVAPPPAPQPPPPPPRIQIKIPPTTLPPARVDKARQKGKTVDTNVSVAKVEAELLSPLNEPIEHNRALTVSLPEEVTIPAGCLVELIEVKTVNGTKELKLRLLSQQENESVVKDSMNTVSQNTALGKTLSSAFNSSSNTAKLGSMGMCTTNRKLCETKTLNLESPAVVLTQAAKSIPNPACKGPRGIKRTLQETINLNVERPTVVPAKVAKSIPNPATKGTCGIKITVQETQTPNAAHPTVVPARRPVPILNPANKGLCVPNRTLHETKKLTQGHSPSLSTRNVSYPKGRQNVQMAVKGEPKEISAKGNTTPGMKEQVVQNDYSGLNQRSVMSASSASSVLTTTNIQGTSSALSVCKDEVIAGEASLMPNTGYSTLAGLLSTKHPKVGGRSTLTESKTSAWTQSGRGNERTFEGDMSEPKGFPVISSVFSLSQQPENSQWCVPPLVLALRGMGMCKGTSSVKTSSDHTKTLSGQKEGKGTPANCGQVVIEGMSTTHESQVTQETSDILEIADPISKHTQNVTRNPSVIKDEEKGATTKGNEKCRKMSCPKSLPSSVKQEVFCTITSPTDVPVAEGLPWQLHSSGEEQNASSRFLTVCLKRVRVGLWKPDKKRRKRNKVSKSKSLARAETRGGSAALPPAPLKVDQLVKQPGPNQPVVVLNHPKPQVLKRGAGANTCADTGPPEVVPKCQILKMRLSKVMGQKYEVVGCTVRVHS